MEYTQKSVLQYIKENDVKFIKLFFTDILGRVKSVSIMQSELERAFETGISFNAAQILGFGQRDADLFLVPDPSTLAVLPWRPQHGRVVRFFCSIKNPDGTQFPLDNRAIVQRAADNAAALGFSCSVGTECEFYLFNVDEKGEPSLPHDNASYCALSPRDKGENIRREICLTLEQMGLLPETSRHKAGPGQHEITFRHSAPVRAADNLTTFKMAVKTVAAKNGVSASFNPKPVAAKSGSGLHINISLEHNGKNLFAARDLPPEAQYFMAGILNRAQEITAFTNPHNDSYKRFGSFEAPKYITWSKSSRAHLIRVPDAASEYSRIELRSPDPSCNHYFAIALALTAGIEGIKNKQPLQDACNFDPCIESGEAQKSKLKTLPQSLAEAAALAEKSDFAQAVLSSETLNAYISLFKNAS
jgi:glutamine synthetase